jgi:phosphonopyruvate decarboxylase
VTVEPTRFCDALAAHGVSFFAGVPDSLLAPFCASLELRVPRSSHVIAANEGNALAIGAGHHLATGGCPGVYLQNSGLGNLVNPLLSLADPEVYGIPAVIIAGWRGEPGVPDEPQHRKQGAVTPALLEAMDYPYRVLRPTDDEANDDVGWAVATAKGRSAPAFLLVRKGTFASSVRLPSDDAPVALSREDAIDAIADAVGPGVAFVATTGMIGRELLEVRTRRGEDTSTDFLTVGSMGHASSIALGVALARPERRVVCLDGDGAMLMHLGAVAIAGRLAPANFAHVVLNNGAHDSVGGQPTVGFDVDLPGIAALCGYRTLGTATDAEQLRRFGPELRSAIGPVFLEARVRRGSRGDLGRPTATPEQSKRRFMTWLAGITSTDPL